LRTAPIRRRASTSSASWRFSYGKNGAEGTFPPASRSCRNRLRSLSWQGSTEVMLITLFGKRATLPMTTLRRILFVSVACMCLSGCATSTKTALRPITNAIPPESPGVYDISKVAVPPVPTYQAPPRYPIELRKARISGEGVILFTVRVDGSVEGASVVRATDARLGELALEAVRKWRFRPARLDGMPVNCRLMVPIKFTLDKK
jgi:TonB family protein